jgi:hypothetical protein
MIPLDLLVPLHLRQTLPTRGYCQDTLIFPHNILYLYAPDFLKDLLRASSTLTKINSGVTATEIETFEHTIVVLYKGICTPLRLAKMAHTVRVPCVSI